MMRNVNRSWWRRLLTTLAPASPDIAERLAGHYATEIRLAHGLTQGAESLTRYPNPRVRVLDAAERARGRAQRIRRVLEELGHPAVGPASRSGPRSMTAGERLRAGVSELSSMSEAYLADAYAVGREHSDMASLLNELHRETAGDGRDLIWTLAQLARTAVNTTSLEAVAA
ncbi:MAG TPA: hypothetical protein VKA83_12375 [Methylomirabilota bacterium]|nr:hypothetical protein [Methylomirabilota bacterium]